VVREELSLCRLARAEVELLGMVLQMVVEGWQSILVEEEIGQEAQPQPVRVESFYFLLEEEATTRPLEQAEQVDRFSSVVGPEGTPRLEPVGLEPAFRLSEGPEGNLQPQLREPVATSRSLVGLEEAF
jgi:hypothetical protein